MDCIAPPNLESLLQEPSAIEELERSVCQSLPESQLALLNKPGPQLATHSTFSCMQE